MSLLPILSVLTAVVFLESASPQPVSHVPLRVAWLAVGLLLWATAVEKIVWHSVHDRGRVVSCRRVEQRLGMLGWLVATGLIWATQWHQIVRYYLSSSYLPAFDELLMMVPCLLPVLLVNGIYDETLRAARQSRTPNLARAVAATALHFRFSGLIVVVPVLIVIGIRDLAAQQHGSLEQGCWLLLGSTAILTLLLPECIRRSWPTQPLPPGKLRRRLWQTVSDQGLAVRDLLVLKTGGRAAVAMVAGLVPRLRYVILGDALLRHFDTTDLEAILSHEVAHIRLRHGIQRGLAVLLPVLLALALGPHLPAWDWMMVVAPMMGMIYLIGGISWLCRQQEHEADLVAARSLHDDLPAGAARLQQAVGKACWLSGGRRGWLHPPPARRLGTLLAWRLQPHSALQLERRMRLVRWLLASTTAIAAVGLFL